MQSTVDTSNHSPDLSSLPGVPAGHHPSTKEGALSECEQKLTSKLKVKGFGTFKFTRVPGDYYDQPLEYRMGILGAPTVEHLCKSMVMMNTKAQVEDCSNWNNSKYYLVILQVRSTILTKSSKVACASLN